MTKFKGVSITAVAVVFGLHAFTAIAAEVTDADRADVDQVIAGGNSATIAAKCKSLEGQKQNADTGVKGDWQALIVKCKRALAALAPPPTSVTPGPLPTPGPNPTPPPGPPGPRDESASHNADATNQVLAKSAALPANAKSKVAGVLPDSGCQNRGRQ